MKERSMYMMVCAAPAIALVTLASTLSAAELPWTNLAGMLRGSPMDISCPQSCDQCKKEFCVERVPVKECVTGKKRVFDCKMCNEYVSIPETRYRFKTRRVTEEVPCCFCKPVCKSRDVNRCYESEEWQTDSIDTCSGCGGLYCKHCQNKTEKVSCKHCGREPGKTTVKVCYKSCVKEAYTVYRQVKKSVCVKQPRFERVKVRITRYVCNSCNGGGCNQCCEQDTCCNEEGCDGSCR